LEYLTNKRGATPEHQNDNGCPNLLVKKGNSLLLKFVFGDIKVLL
jgi:hypothetical protein